VRVDLVPDVERTDAIVVTVIAVAPDALRYSAAAFVSGDLAGRAWPVPTSTSVIAKGNIRA
jgi:hypothetical protein